MIEISAGIDLTALTLGALALAVLLETLAPLRPAEQLTRRWLHNGALAVVTYMTSYFLITAVALWVVHWSSQLPGLSLEISAALPLWIQCVIVFFYSGVLPLRDSLAQPHRAAVLAAPCDPSRRP